MTPAKSGLTVLLPLVAVLALSGCALTARMGCNSSLSTPGQDIFPYYPTGITVGGRAATPEEIRGCMTSKGYPPGSTIWTPKPTEEK